MWKKNDSETTKNETPITQVDRPNAQNDNVSKKRSAESESHVYIKRFAKRSFNEERAEVITVPTKMIQITIKGQFMPTEAQISLVN